jgi:hypothetical protein
MLIYAPGSWCPMEPLLKLTSKERRECAVGKNVSLP